MISFNFCISWPQKQVGSGKDYFYKEGNLWRTKHWEIQCSKIGNELLGFGLRFDPIGSDHGGLHIEFNFMRRMLAFAIYDSRHWNYEENRWYKDGEEDDGYIPYA